METTVAPNLKYKIDKNSPVDIMARLFGLSQKLAPTRKIVPTDQHYQHVFATLLHRLLNHQRKRLKGPDMVHEAKFPQSYNKTILDQSTHRGSLEARVIKAQ